MSNSNNGIISGKLLRDAIISGANNINHEKRAVDELNVFPVPDGDTGTNMSMTISAASRELAKLPDDVTVGETAKVCASSLLRGARGNSGVILSLIFRGFAKGLAEKSTANGEDLAKALDSGVKGAYKAVMKPTEGTILTVARVAAEVSTIFAKNNKIATEVWSEICKVAQTTLDETPEMLPVLKKAGVVDAGGRGLVLIFEGMLNVFKTGTILTFSGENELDAIAAQQQSERVASAAGEAEADINFTYCTEFIVNRENQKDPLKLRAFLESMGDCVVVVEDEEIIKVHVHTNNPGNALQEGLKFGSLTSMKIENMRLQHEKAQMDNAKSISDSTKAKFDPEYAPVDPSKEFGFVAVSAGDGIDSLFMDLGADFIVSGGQTMNPSTDDILKAVHATPSKTVFVLPNNKNIIMAAEQTIPLADRTVIVLHTKTIPQGLSAMLSFDPDRTVDENQLAMTAAAANVQTGQITFAARDSDFDGHKIKEGELLALHNNKLVFTERDLVKASAKLAKQIIKKDTGFVTIIFGSDVLPAQAKQIEDAIKTKINSNIEVTAIAGQQPVYYVIMSAE